MSHPFRKVPDGWVMTDTMNHNLMPFRPTPNDWIVLKDGPASVVLADPYEIFGSTQDRVTVKAGEIVFFTPFFNEGFIEVELRSDGTFTIIDGEEPPPDYQITDLDYAVSHHGMRNFAHAWAMRFSDIDGLKERLRVSSWGESIAFQLVRSLFSADLSFHPAMLVALPSPQLDETGQPKKMRGAPRRCMAKAATS